MYEKMQKIDCKAGLHCFKIYNISFEAILLTQLKAKKDKKSDF